MLATSNSHSGVQSFIRFFYAQGQSLRFAAALYDHDGVKGLAFVQEGPRCSSRGSSRLEFPDRVLPPQFWPRAAE